jgi:hypothetical protein
MYLTVGKKALLGVLCIAIVAAVYLWSTSGREAPKYGPGNRWTWKVTRQSLDPLTDNVLSERTYEQVLEYIGEEVRDGFSCSVFKLTREGTPGYGRLFRVIRGSEVGELGSESYDENGRKVSEYFYSKPILLWKFPMNAGDRFSDLKTVTGYDNLAGMEKAESTEMRSIEVVGEETLLMPAKIKTVRLRSYGSSWGTIRVGGVEGRILVTFQENTWYSPEVREVVKSVTESFTILMLGGVTSATRSREERMLVSYT